MSRPDLHHSFRTTYIEHSLKEGSTSKPTQKQRDKKEVRDRIEQKQEEREFKKLWGEL